MVKAERIIRYTQIAPEAALDNEIEKPPPSWPSDGKITFDHVSFAYDTETPIILKNIYCDIQAKEKVTICKTVYHVCCNLLTLKVLNF